MGIFSRKKQEYVTPKYVTKPNQNATATAVFNNHEYKVFGGLTKRETFAAMAMQGLCDEFQTSESHDIDVCERVALRAVRMADALIDQLNKTNP